jgi:hypothetical protein
VRLRLGPEDARDLHAPPTHAPREILELHGGRHHAQPRGRGALLRGLRPAPARPQGQGRHRHGESGAVRRRAPCPGGGERDHAACGVESHDREHDRRAAAHVEVPRGVEAEHAGRHAERRGQGRHGPEGAAQEPGRGRRAEQEGGEEHVAHGAQRHDGRQGDRGEQQQVEQSHAVAHRLGHGTVEGGEHELLAGEGEDDGHDARNAGREDDVRGGDREHRAEEHVLEPAAVALGERDQHDTCAEERGEEHAHRHVLAEAPVRGDGAHEHDGEEGDRRGAEGRGHAEEEGGHHAEHDRVGHRLPEEGEAPHEHEAPEGAARRPGQDGLGQRAAHEPGAPRLEEPVHGHGWVWSPASSTATPPSSRRSSVR